MKVNLVGTSCTWYAKNNTSFILDDRMLFDISSGNYKQVIKSIDIFDLNAIFISHLHSDHVGDLHIITTRFIRETNDRGRTEKLRIYGQKGLAEFLIEHAKLYFGSDEIKSLDILKDSIDFIEVYDGFEFEECGYKIKVYKMLHGDMECYGYSFKDDSGKVVSFSADTAMCDSLNKMISSSNFAFVDMAAITTNQNHITVNEFISLSKKYKNCTMIPVHMSDKSYEVSGEFGIKRYQDGDIVIC